GRARSTVGRRLSTLAGFYRYCEQDQILARSPAAHVRRPKQDYESRTLGLDRNELGAFLGVVDGPTSQSERQRDCFVSVRLFSFWGFAGSRAPRSPGVRRSAGPRPRRGVGKHPGRPPPVVRGGGPVSDEGGAPRWLRSRLLPPGTR